MHKWVLDKLELEQVLYREIQAKFVEIAHRPLRGLDPRINPDKQPRNYKEAMVTSAWGGWVQSIVRLGLLLIIRNISDSKNEEYSR